MHQLPQLDEISRIKLKKLLAMRGMVPVMNNTKWAKLINTMLHSPEMVPQFKLRSVLASSDHVMDWDGEWYYHIHPVAEIEWIDLKALSCAWLESTLRQYSIPYSIEAESFRVWGYVKPDSSPNWVG